MRTYRALLIPDWLGSTQKSGVQWGPAILNNKIIFSQNKIDGTLLGDYFADSPILVPVPQYLSSSYEIGMYKKYKYLPEIKKICKNSKEAITKIVNEKELPIVLMGDDSSLIGVLSGISLKHTENFGLIYFDAHADINTPNTSISGCMFGMPLAYLLNIENIAHDFDMEEPFLKGQNIVMIGARNIGTSEWNFITQHRIKLYSPASVNRLESKELCEDILEYYREKNLTGLFIHVDVDVLDPSESPGTLLLEPNGIKAKKLCDIISCLASTNTNLGLSISEYNPPLDREKKTLNITMEILHSYIKNSYDK